jgi:hypothetical protein
MRAHRQGQALVVLAVIAAWHALLAGLSPEPAAPGTSDPDLVEHQRNWYDYVRGFHAHHGSIEGDHPDHGSFFEGLSLWRSSAYLRGYTLGDDVYLCPGAPRILRVHQAGHAPSFGRQFDPLRTERRDDGGLEDEPLRTLDVMLPGGFPHTFLRVRDPRGLGETYDRWLRDGSIARR